MRKNNIKIFILSIFTISLLLLVNLTSVVADADKFYIDDFSDYAYGNSHITSNNMVVDSDGDYYIFVFNDTTPFDCNLLKSTDTGDTWVSSKEFDMSTESDFQIDFISTYIDDDDIIHIGYGYGTSATTFNVSYRNYNTGTDTISAFESIYTGNTDRVLWGLSIAINDNDEICIGWGEVHAPSTERAYIKSKVYNDQTSVWGDTKLVFDTGLSADSKINGLSMDILSNDTFVFSYIYYISAVACTFGLSYFDYYVDSVAQYTTVTLDYSMDQLYTDVAIDSLDNIHCVFEEDVSTGDINYLIYNTSTDWTDNYRLVESTESCKPNIAINSDDTVQIVFIGDNGATPSNYVMGYYGNYGGLSGLQYYQSGVTDDMDSVFIVYQKLQSFTHLSDGIVGYYVNSSSDYAYHFDEGYELFYGASEQDNGTSGEGFPQCEASGWIIEKQFVDSIGYYNDTLAFVIKRTTPLFGLYAIMNSTFDVVQSGSFYGATYPTWYFVDPQYGTGTYYFVAGYTWGVWAVNCSFTIVTEGSVSDLWILESTKPTFNVGEDVILRYVIPSGQYGNITVTEDGDPLETLTVANILGTGGYETISFGVSQVGDLCYHAYLRNASNNVLRASTPKFCIGESYFDYDIFVDGEKEVTVTAKDTVSISGYVQGIKSDVYIFMVYDNITRYSWAVGDATNKILFARNWRIDYNYTLGDEVYYLYLGTSYGLFEDKFVTLTVSDYAGEPTPFDDGSWYGLPFWVPYLIGVFLTLFVTMSPLIIGTYITRNSRIEKINIPPLLYVGFFYFGLIISVAIGFLPIWLPFVILFAMIVYFAVSWLAGKQASIQGE